MSWESILKTDDINNMFDIIIEHWPEHTKFTIIWKEGDEFRIAPDLSGERTYITMGETFIDDKKVETPKERRPFFMRSESKVIPITNADAFINKMEEMGARVQDRPEYINWQKETVPRRVIIRFELDRKMGKGGLPAVVS